MDTKQLAWPLPPVLQAMKRLGYAVFTGPWNVNVWGIRMGGDFDDLPAFGEGWNDLLGVSWQDEYGIWHERIHPGTTDPGLHLLTHKPVNARGTSVMLPGQYRGAYKMGLHNGRPALVHWGHTPISYWRVTRDGLRYNAPDGTPLVERGYIGLNIHGTLHPDDNPPRAIGPWSAGCQVRQVEKDHTEFLDIVEVSTARYGDYVTYTLLTEGQVWHAPTPQDIEVNNAPPREFELGPPSGHRRTYSDLLPDPGGDPEGFGGSDFDDFP